MKTKKHPGTESAEKLLQELTEIESNPPQTSNSDITEGKKDFVPTGRHKDFSKLYEGIKQNLNPTAKFNPTDLISVKLRNASLRDVVWCLTEIADQLRLEEGKATENIAVSQRLVLTVDYANRMDKAGGGVVEGSRDQGLVIGGDKRRFPAKAD